MFSTGYDVQAAFYRRGVKAVFGVDAKFRFVVVESTPPYALSVIRPESSVFWLGDRKIEVAKNIWRECLKTNVWPGYPPMTQTIELPEWEEKKWLAREEASILSN